MSPPIASARRRASGALLLTAGAKNKRFALPNARIMIHQPLAGLRGTSTEFQIYAKEYLRMKAHLNGVLVKHTGKTLDQSREGHRSRQLHVRDRGPRLRTGRCGPGACSVWPRQDARLIILTTDQ